MATKGNFSSEVDTPSTTSASVVDGGVTFTYEHPPIGDQPAVTPAAGAAAEAALVLDGTEEVRAGHGVVVPAARSRGASPHATK